MSTTDSAASEVAVDPDPWASFDRYARMVRRALDVPVALVSLVEAERQVFVGMSGLPLGTPVRAAEDRGTPLTHSFCQHVVAEQRPLVISDAREHSALRDNLAVPDLGVVAYAGWPITDHTGAVVGSLCAIDHEARHWTSEQEDLLGDLAAACSAELSQRGLRHEAVVRERAATELSHRSRVLLALSESLAAAATLAEVAAAVERTAHEHLGCVRAGIWMRAPEHASPAADVPRAAPHDSEVLRWVDPAASGPDGAQSTWEQARHHGDLPIDGSNPLGEALASRRPLFFRDRDSQDDHYPGLGGSDRVGQSRAFLPLAVRGRVLGTLVLLWEHVGEVPQYHRVTIAALANYTAQAVQRAMLLQERVDALLTLQSAMTSELPSVPSHPMAARYRPASTREKVGGDWYDAVVLPSGSTALVVGDVAGHDMRAAGTMGQLRSMLRAIAWTVDEAPSETVTRLDQAARDLGVDGIATLVFARLDRDERTGGAVLSWANAGHPPPVVVGPDGRPRLLGDHHHAPMVGVAPSTHRHDHRAELAAGSTLLLYTDGLVERRHEHPDTGLERLLASTARHGTLPVGEFVDAVLDELLDAEHADDVAVLAVRIAPRASEERP